jgi:zinc protease
MPHRTLRGWSALTTALLLVSGLLLAPVSATVRPPPLEYEFYTLPNGLKVVLHHDDSTPIVNLQLWYHVGSKDEREGRSGFAHLFEHMMFKGSRNVAPEAHTSYIASVGGQSNAYTTEDTTVFWETVPQHRRSGWNGKW